MSNGGFKQQLLVSDLVYAKSGREAIKKPISGFALGDGFADSSIVRRRAGARRSGPSPLGGAPPPLAGIGTQERHGGEYYRRFPGESTFDALHS
jgi:hypothetical protein